MTDGGLRTLEPMIDRLAIILRAALCNPSETEKWNHEDYWHGIALIAVSAMREPTRPVLTAACNSYNAVGKVGIGDGGIWRDMIDAVIDGLPDR